MQDASLLSASVVFCQSFLPPSQLTNNTKQKQFSARLFRGSWRKHTRQTAMHLYSLGCYAYKSSNIKKAGKQRKKMVRRRCTCAAPVPYLYSQPLFCLSVVLLFPFSCFAEAVWRWAIERGMGESKRSAGKLFSSSSIDTPLRVRPRRRVVILGLA